MIEQDTPFLVERLPLFVHPGSATMSEPFGKSGITRAILLTDRHTLFQVGNVVAYPAGDAFCSAFFLDLVLFFSDGQPVSSLFGLVEIIEQPIGKWASRFVFDGVDIVFKEIAVMDAFILRMFFRKFRYEFCS